MRKLRFIIRNSRTGSDRRSVVIHEGPIRSDGRRLQICSSTIRRKVVHPKDKQKPEKIGVGI